MIRAEIEECHKLTKQLQYITSNSLKWELADEQYDQIMILLEKREQLLSRIKKPFTGQEKQYGLEIIKWNSEIENNLKSIKRKLQSNLKDIKKIEQSVPKYLGYDYSGVNSYYYDKRN